MVVWNWCQNSINFPDKYWPFPCNSGWPSKVIKSTYIYQDEEQLDIAAFRVHPGNYEDEGLVNVKDVPRRKAVDFGYHYKKYYQIPIEIVTNENGWETLKKVEKM